MNETGTNQACKHPVPGAEAMQAARRLQEVFRRFRRMMKRPAAGHRKMAEMSVMKTVAFHHVETGEGIRISEIASQLKIAPPTVTQFINNLEKAGWVERSMDPQDRRSVLVRLTEEGRRCHERFEADMLHLFEGLTLHLGLEDAAHLARILDKSFAYLEEATQHHEHHHH
jgi:DNA-binding MarR family transcriptional regulator